jgi:hypothetical protein
LPIIFLAFGTQLPAIHDVREHVEKAVGRKNAANVAARSNAMAVVHKVKSEN